MITDPINRLAAVNDILLGSDKDLCIDTSSASWVACPTNISWNEHRNGWKQWIWQTCTEFVWYQTTYQTSGVYGHSVPLEFKEQTCRDVFGE